VRFCSIGSGSKGNGTLIQHGETCILVDTGFTLKDVEFRLAKKGLTPLDLTAILITHEHSDHIKGVGPLSRKYRIPVYCSHGTSQYDGLGNISNLVIFDSHETFEIGALSITPVVVPHDAREPTQFVIQGPDKQKLGILTDLGSLTPHILELYSGCHGLMLETNHDVQMLRMGPYPPKLKVRVEGPLGHLNNQQAAQLLRNVDCDNLQFLVATHISEKNNNVAVAIDAISHGFSWEKSSIIMATQELGFPWCEL
jgi:phosphoribosyl 1,2-cyclic phosphodiesterase